MPKAPNFGILYNFHEMGNNLAAHKSRSLLLVAILLAPMENSIISQTQIFPILLARASTSALVKSTRQLLNSFNKLARPCLARSVGKLQAHWPAMTWPLALV